MPLEILGPLVVVGLLLVIGAVHFSGGSIARNILDEKNAQQRFALDFPDYAAGKVILDANHQTAFLLFRKPEELGLVRKMGHHSLTRLIAPGSVREFGETPEGLKLRLNDVTLPVIEFRCKNSKQKTLVIQALENIYGDKSDNS